MHNHSSSHDTVAAAGPLEVKEKQLFPCPSLKAVEAKPRTGRARQRAALRTHVRGAANRTIAHVNELSAAACESREFSSRKVDPSVAAIFASLHGDIERRENALARAGREWVGHGNRGKSLDGARTGSGSTALGELCGDGAEQYTRSILKRVQPVLLTKSNVASVAEPTDERCVDLLAALPAQARGLFEKDSSGRFRFLLSEDFSRDESFQRHLAQVDSKWRWNGASRGAMGEYFKTFRSRGFWAFVRPDEAKCFNSLFFIPKKNGKSLRKIMACVPANARMVNSPPVQLPGPWEGARVRVRGKRFWVGDVDVQSMFTRIRIPLEIGLYFCALPIRAKLVMTPSEIAAGGFTCPISHQHFSPSDIVAPAYCRIPMGWSLAVFAALNVMSTIVPPPSGPSLNLPAQETHTLPVDDGDVVAGTFIDNVYAFGTEAGAVQTYLDTARQRLDQAGLVVGETHAVARSAKEVGMIFDGAQGKIRYPPEKAWVLRIAAEHLARHRRVRGDTLRQVVGHFTWAFGLRRCLFSVFGATYRFLDTVGDGWGWLWPTVARELNSAARLLIFAEADLGRVPADFCVCTDASLSGGGAVYTPVSPGDAQALCADPLLENPVGVRDGPLCVWIEKQNWKLLAKNRWRYHEHINALEARAFVKGVDLLGRAGVARGSDLLVLTDSSVVFGAVRKGRSSKISLRPHLRRLAALQLLLDVRVLPRWIPTDKNAADAPSRGRHIAT